MGGVRKPLPPLLLLAAAAAAAAAAGLMTGLLWELGVVRMSTMLSVGEHQRALSRSNLLGGVVSWGTPIISLRHSTPHHTVTVLCCRQGKLLQPLACYRCRPGLTAMFRPSRSTRRAGRAAGSQVSRAPVALHGELLTLLQPLPGQFHELRAHVVVKARHADLPTRAMQAAQQLHKVCHGFIEHAAIVAAVQVTLRARYLQNTAGIAHGQCATCR